MEYHAQYKLEEMKQLRSLIVAYIQEIAKLEIYTITSVAAIIYFSYNYSGTSKAVQIGIQYGPAFLTLVILAKAGGFAWRIYQIDKYLTILEKDFVSEGAWIKYFYAHYFGRWVVVLERLLLTLVFFALSIAWIWVSPVEFRVSGEQ